MNLHVNHHRGHRVPFEDSMDDPVGDRRDLKVLVGDLRRLLRDSEAHCERLEHDIAHLRHELARLHRRRWWQR
jgi:hypothetical protein